MSTKATAIAAEFPILASEVGAFLRDGWTEWEIRDAARLAISGISLSTALTAIHAVTRGNLLLNSGP